MKNMLTDIDTNVTLEIRKWLCLHKEEFKEKHLPCVHRAYLFDDDGNIYSIAIKVKKVELDEEQRQV